MPDITTLQSPGAAEAAYGVLRPTAHAVATAWALLVHACPLFPKDTPHWCVSTDSAGGLRVEWWTPTGDIRLIVPSVHDNTPYIYYDFGAEYGIDRPATAEKLAHWITQLTV